MEEGEIKNFTKGFNHGYLIANHDKGLAQALEGMGAAKSSYFDGLRQGMKEMSKERNLNEFDKLRNNKDELSRGIDI